MICELEVISHSFLFIITCHVICDPKRGLYF